MAAETEPFDPSQINSVADKFNFLSLVGETEFGWLLGRFEPPDPVALARAFSLLEDDSHFREISLSQPGDYLTVYALEMVTLRCKTHYVWGEDYDPGRGLTPQNVTDLLYPDPDSSGDVPRLIFPWGVARLIALTSIAEHLSSIPKEERTAMDKMSFLDAMGEVANAWKDCEFGTCHEAFKARLHARYVYLLLSMRPSSD